VKKWFSSRKTLFFALIILFVLGQLLGTLAIKALFIDYKVKELSPRLKYISDEIANGTFSISRNNDFILKAYDIYGVEMNLFKEEAHETAGISDPLLAQSLEGHIQKVITGNELATLEKIEGHMAESIVIGLPIVRQGKVIGAAFLLKPASDFEAVLRGFYIVFSITLLVGACFIGLFLYLYLKESKKLEQTRRDYIANISHELKSPIASIKALTETLADKVIQDEDTREKYYSIILNESRRLQKLISDMLELSRLQSRKLAFHQETIHTKDLMQDLLQKYLMLSNDLGLTFEVTEKAISAPDLYVNRDRLLQIFTILLDNAIKFVREEGRVVIDAEIYAKKVKFRVIDNGVGIDPSILPYIFDRFYKEDTSHNAKGSGLGLAIAKELITALDETISVSSAPDVGTAFAFTVQRA
jgi:signal transduction histidine kinase